ESGRFQAVQRIDCAFSLLPSAKPLRNHSLVYFHTGTVEAEARIRSLDSPDGIAPGQRSYARVDLREPLLVLPGDRFIVRKFSPVVTIGGGEVLDVAPPRRPAVERLTTLEHGGDRQRLTLLVGESKFGMSMQDLVARTGLLESEIRAAIQTSELMVLPEPQFWV